MSAKQHKQSEASPVVKKKRPGRPRGKNPKKRNKLDECTLLLRCDCAFCGGHRTVDVMKSPSNKSIFGICSECKTRSFGSRGWALYLQNNALRCDLMGLSVYEMFKMMNEFEAQ